MSILSFLTLGMLHALMALFGLLIPLLVVGSQRSVVLGAGVVGALHLIDTWFIGSLALPLGIAVTPFDFAFGVLALALLGRLGQVAWQDRLLRLWVATCLVWLGLFALGAVLHKTKAGVEFRQYFYLSVGVAYVMSFRITPELARRLLANLALFAMGTLAIALYRWGMEIFDRGIHPWQESPGQLNWRVINAQQTFVLVILLLASLSAIMARTRAASGAWWLLAPVLLCAVALLQHRTDWLVLLAAGVVLLAAQRTGRGGRAALLGTALAAVVVLGTVGAMLGGGIGESLQSSVAEPFSRKSTLNWRLDSWREVARGWWNGGPAVWPFGFAFGHGWRRFIESSGTAGLHWEVSPHSFYVTTLARGGIAALGLLAWAVVVALKRHLQAARRAQGDWPDAALMVSLLAAQLVFFISYSIVPMASIVVGLVFATAVARPVVAQPQTVWRGGRAYA
jgi:hypothetical protein